MASDQQPPAADPEDVQRLLRELEHGAKRRRISAAWRLCLLAEEHPALVTDLARSLTDRGGTASSLVYQWLEAHHALELDSGPGTGTDADWALTDPRTGDAGGGEEYGTDQVVFDGGFMPTATAVTDVSVFRSIQRDSHVRTYAGMATIDGAEQAVFVRTYVPPQTTPPRAVRTRCRDGFEQWGQVDTHPNVMQIYEFGTDPHPWSILEYATETLGSVGRMPPDVGLRVVRDVATGLAAAHEVGVTHLTLTPQMVALDRRGPQPVPRIIGTGMQEVITTFRGDPGLDTRFAAPEHTGDGALDWATDIYLLGGLLYAAVTGHPPFERSPGPRRTLEPPSSVAEHVPAAVDPLIQKTLASSKLDRYESVDEFLRDLQRVLEP